MEKMNLQPTQHQCVKGWDECEYLGKQGKNSGDPEAAAISCKYLRFRLPVGVNLLRGD